MSGVDVALAEPLNGSSTAAAAADLVGVGAPSR